MRRLVPLSLLLSLVLVACGGASGGEQAGASGGPSSEVTPLGTLTGGDPLPEATLPDLRDDSRTVAMSSYVGTPTVVNFWATWCAFCVEEMPDLEDVDQQLGDQVQFVGIDREDPNRQAALSLANDTGVTYPLLIDADGSYFRAVQGRGMPTTLFVDADGVIQYRHAGPVTADQLLDLVQEHLGVSATG